MVALRETITAARKERGLSQKKLASRIGIAESTLSKMLGGTSFGTTRETLRRLRDIEKVLKLEAGSLSSMLGVAEPGTALIAIHQDPSLPPDVRHALAVLVKAIPPAEASVSQIGNRRGSGSGVAERRRAKAAEGGKVPKVSKKARAGIAEHVEERKPTPAKKAQAPGQKAQAKPKPRAPKKPDA